MTQDALDGKRVTMLVTNDVSRDARVQKEAVALAGVGAEVVIVGVGDHTEWSYPGVSIRLVAKLVPSSSPWRLIRIARNLAAEDRFARALGEAASATDPDIIHANDLDTLRSAFIAAAGKTPVVYDAHEVSTEGGLLPWWKRRIWWRREAQLGARAAAVITVNEHIARWLQSRHGWANRPFVVMNGSSECVGSGEPAAEPLRLLFQGQFFADRNLETLVRAVVPHAGKVVLSLQGWGEEETRLKEMVDRLQLHDTVKFVPACRPAETVTSAAMHDVGLIVHKPENLNHYLSSPNKLFDYLGAGLAIVASDLPVFRDIVADNGIGLVFQAGDEAALSAAIGEMVSAPERVSEMKRRAAGVCQRYSWDEQKKVLLDAYEQALGRARG